MHDPYITEGIFHL